MPSPPVDPALARRVVETTTAGVWIIDAESVTTYVNEAMATMLGISAEELVGRTMFDVMDEEGQRIAAANVARRKKGIAEQHPFLFRRGDGTPLWAVLSTTPWSDPDGQYAGALAIVTPLGDLGTPAARDELWRILEESLNEIYLFDAETLRFVYVNRGALRNLGYTLPELRARTPVDIKPLHDEASFRAMVAPLLDGETEKLTFETVHERMDGTRYPVEVDLQLVTYDGKRAFLAVINDISERRRAEDALSASDRRFRAIIEHSHDLVAVANPEGRLTFASPSFVRLLGYTEGELLSSTFALFIDPEDLPRAQQGFMAAVKTGTGPQLEFRVRRKDGGVRVMVGTAQSLLDDPAVGGVVLTARDVTDERALEDQLRLAQRLESIGRLAGGVAHDFNNLLTSILGCAAFLAQDEALSDEARADVAEIRRAGERASELTSQLLAFARRQRVRPALVDVGALVLRQDRFLRRLIGERFTLRSVVGDALPPVQVDPTQLEQAIMNLVVNARDALTNGGTITITVRATVLDEAFARARAEVVPGRHVLIEIHDDGSGIAPDVLPHIFEPFFTTKGVGEGTGLGLAMVYGIMGQCAGHVWVESEPGAGTTFTLALPAAAAAEDDVAASSAAARGDARAGQVPDEDG